jgi:hypothetical protein
MNVQLRYDICDEYERFDMRKSSDRLPVDYIYISDMRISAAITNTSA